MTFASLEAQRRADIRRRGGQLIRPSRVGKPLRTCAGLGAELTAIVRVWYEPKMPGLRQRGGSAQNRCTW